MRLLLGVPCLAFPRGDVPCLFFFTNDIFLLLSTYIPCCQHTYHVVNIHTMLSTYRPCCQHTDRVVNIHTVLSTYIPCCQHTDRVVNIQTVLSTYRPCCQLSNYFCRKECGVDIGYKHGWLIVDMTPQQLQLYEHGSVTGPLIDSLIYVHNRPTHYGENTISFNAG